MENDDFFPSEDYKMPDTSNYLKLTEGSHKFRVLSSAVVGFKYFNTENHPVRSREEFESMPSDIKKGERIVHFWAFVVYNYETKRVQIMEISQKSIMKDMKAYIDNPDWGSPKKYDITINRKGTSKNDTEYTVMPSPHKEVDPEIVELYKSTEVDLNKLFTGDDPFGKKE